MHASSRGGHSVCVALVWQIVLNERMRRGGSYGCEEGDEEGQKGKTNTVCSRGSRKPPISMEGAGLDGGGDLREGQKWVLADEEGYLLTGNEPKGSLAVQDRKSETKRCTVRLVNISITSHRLRWKPINKFSLKTMIKHTPPPLPFPRFSPPHPHFLPRSFTSFSPLAAQTMGTSYRWGF